MQMAKLVNKPNLLLLCVCVSVKRNLIDNNNKQFAALVCQRPYLFGGFRITH